MANNTRVRTAADLETKYLAELIGVKKATETNTTGLIKLNKTTQDYMVVTNQTLENMQSQIDGSITTWFYSGVPTLSNLPASEWTTDIDKDKHLGDLYYDQNTGYAYRFYLDGATQEYGWTKIVDADVTEALAVANAAKDTADSKRTTFSVQPIPPYQVGDIWFHNDEIYRCVLGRQESDEFHASDWINDLKYTDDTAANQAQAELDDFKIEVTDTYTTQADLSTATNEIKGVVAGHYEELTTKVDSKVGTSDFEQYQEDVETQFIQQQDSFNFQFNDVQTQINSVDGQVTENQRKLSQYIRFVNGDIVLGEEGNEYTLRIENDRIVIYYNGVDISKWIQDKFYAKEIYLGDNSKFAFTPRDNGSISFRKVSE